jgi:pimeloyl-ACP methyl ester carboxylesterase
MRSFFALLVSGLVAMTAQARAEQPSVETASKAAGLRIETGTVPANGVALYYRDIGPADVPPVVLLHGFPETGDAFAPVVAVLGKRYRLIVPDLRGAGASQVPAAGYDKRIVATDVKAVMDRLGIARAHVIGHDLGARVAVAFAVQYPARLLSFGVAEAFIEGLAGTAEFKRFAATNPRLQHFARFAKVDDSFAEYQGKEEELVLSFMNSRSKTRKFLAPYVTRYVASLKREGGLRAAFLGYEAFDRDAAFLERADFAKLADVQALALVCQSPAGNGLQRQLAAAGLKKITPVTLERCAHWITEENPEETLPAILNFLIDASAVR